MEMVILKIPQRDLDLIVSALAAKLALAEEESRKAAATGHHMTPARIEAEHTAEVIDTVLSGVS